MSPIEKLLRLREIQIALSQLPHGFERGAELLQERDTILATVAAPPHHLEGEDNPAAWADEFTRLFPTVDRDLAAIWFNAAILSGKEVAAPDNDTERADRMEKVLRLIAKGLEAGQIWTAVAVKDETRPELQPVSLVLAIRNALGEE